MKWRSILAGVSALLVAVVVVRNAVVVQSAKTNPQLAARVWPSHPSSQLWLGLTQIGLSARARKPVAPATLALIRDAAMKAPLAPEPFLVRGVEGQMAGNSRLATAAFVGARLRNGRSIPARYFLAEQYFRRGDAPRGLREIAILARMIPDGVNDLAPFVASYAKDPRTQPQLRALFRSDPGLEQAALTTLATDARNADLILGLATPSAKAPQWTEMLLRSLIKDGQYGKAQRIWARLGHVRPAPNSIFDAKFEGSDASAPFNWTLTSSTAGLAERQPGGRLHVIFYGQEDGLLAGQLLVLAPGRYRLAMHIEAEAARAAALRWSVTCAGSGRTLLSLPVSDVRHAAAGVPFDVPADCGAQNLQLLGSAPELPQQVEVTISNLALVREQANG
ncbi:MAG TPA: hypothetical protein VIZ66_06805 [Sphingomicrobium sp.]